jgi:hypothetical protein
MVDIQGVAHSLRQKRKVQLRPGKMRLWLRRPASLTGRPTAGRLSGPGPSTTDHGPILALALRGACGAVSWMPNRRVA